MNNLQLFLHEGLVVLAYVRAGCDPVVIAYLSPTQADAHAAAVKELSDIARRHWETVQQLKTGA